MSCQGANEQLQEKKFIVPNSASLPPGYLLSCMANSVNMALTLLAPMTIPMMLFGGFFLNEK